MTESFWAVPQAPTMRTPLSILREQAAALTQKTSGLLVGEVTTPKQSSADDELSIGLSIKVPALNNYVYHILNYQQPIVLYPGTLRTRFDNDWHEVPDHQAFIDLLQKILSSAEVGRIIEAL